MKFAGELWYRDDHIVYYTNQDEFVIMNLIQLLPIEMVILCEQQAMFNPLIVFEKYNWRPSWFGLSDNKSLTMAFVLKYINSNWYWHMVSKNKRITMSDIRNHPEIPWNYQSMSINPNLTTEFLLKNLDQNWEWQLLFKNKAFTINDIRLIKQYAPGNYSSWQYPDVTKNPNIIMAFVHERIKDYLSMDMFFVSKNKEITMDEICTNSRISWSYEGVSLNPNLSMLFVLKNLHLNWNWCSISQNKAIDMNDVRSNPNLPWDYNYLSKNVNLTIDFILQNLNNANEPNSEWDWYRISQNKGINMTDISNNPQLPWEYRSISGNPNLTMEYVLTHLNENWSLLIWGNPSVFVY